MMGWTYWDVQTLPVDVYAVLIEELKTEVQKEQNKT